MKKIKQFIHFIKKGIWKDKQSDKTRPFRIIVYTVKGAIEHNLMINSAALTFYTIMSLVPIVALIFAILKGFGFEENLTDYLYSTFGDYSNVLDAFMEFVNRMLEKTRGGVVAAVGVVVLLWSVIKVFGNVEDAFNKIWDVKKSRSMSRKFTDYMAVIFIAPILLVSSLSLGTVIRSTLSFLNISWIVEILLWIASFIIIWLLFAFIYRLIPNTKVGFKGAFIAGIIAGTVFLVFSLLYFYIQAKVSSYNVIYGTFAAIPLFLGWMQISWQILLVGAELSYAYQNINKYDRERTANKLDIDHKRKILLATMLSVIKIFVHKEGNIYAEKIAEKLQIPVRIIRQMLFELEKARLIVEVNNENHYVPAVDVHTIKVSDVLEKFENNIGGNDYDSTQEMKEINSLLNTIRDRAFEPDLNKYLIDMI